MMSEFIMLTELSISFNEFQSFKANLCIVIICACVYTYTFKCVFVSWSISLCWICLYVVWYELYVIMFLCCRECVMFKYRFREHTCLFVCVCRLMNVSQYSHNVAPAIPWPLALSTPAWSPLRYLPSLVLMATLL